MIELTYPEIISAVSGFAGGSIIGASIITKTEMDIRRFDEARPQRSAIQVLLRSIIRVLIVAALVVSVVLIILRANGLIALNRHQYLAFSFSGLAGAAAGKYVRYLYWKKRNSTNTKGAR